MFKPLGNKVLVERIKMDTGNLIELPETVAIPSHDAKVVALGTKGPFDVKAGDTVKIALYCGTPVIDNGIEYWIIDQKDLLYVYES